MTTPEAHIIESVGHWLRTEEAEAGTLAAGRNYQQDAIAYNGVLWAVADGMGGHRDGDIAARVALDALCRAVTGPVDEGSLRAGFSAANDAVLRLAEPGEMRSPGTTLVVLARRAGGGLLVASTGDSRAYRVRGDGRWDQLTVDHEDPSGALTAYLGDPGEDGIRVDVHTVTAEAGVRVLLCSDGLFGHVGQEELEELLSEGFERLLIGAAETSRDNVTAVLVDTERFATAR